MTLTPQHIQHRNRVLAAAVAQGRLVHGSQAYMNFSTLFDIDPDTAERTIAQLQPSPLAAARGGAPDPTAPQSDEYDPNWLSGPERARISRAHAGYPAVSHSFE
jgi:hypothetical protein